MTALKLGKRRYSHLIGIVFASILGAFGGACIVAEAVVHVMGHDQTNVAGQATKPLAALAKPVTHLDQRQKQFQSDDRDISNFIGTTTHGQLRLLGQLPGPDGMTAVALEQVAPGNSNSKFIGWVLPNKQGLMIGAFIDPSGNNLTRAVMQPLQIQAGLQPASAKTPPPVSAPPVAPLTKQIAEAKFLGFSEGNGPLKVTIFWDPNCIVCHQLWAELHADVNYKSKFTITWVPIGAFKESSAAKAATVMQEGGLPGLNADEENFDVEDEVGSAAISTDQAWLKKIRDNTAKWQTLMVQNNESLGTPTLILDGKQIVVGLPQPLWFQQNFGKSFP